MKNVLITGGSGTLGNALTQHLKDDCQITIYSRSEYLQALMRKAHPQCRFILGDVADYARLEAAIAGHDTVIHAAAMKRIPECEQQPEACWTTNVLGSMNVAAACVAQGVETCVGISTDKACQPVTVYGASKLVMERVFQKQPEGVTRFVLVRYGNVLESRGSVIPLWKEQLEQGQPITITDKNMTRFWMTPSQAVETVMNAYANLIRGEVLVPRMKALPITKMAEYVFGEVEQVEVGLRSMERVHEWLVGPDEVAQDCGNCYIVNPQQRSGARSGSTYRSDTAAQLAQTEFLEMLAEVERV